MDTVVQNGMTAIGNVVTAMFGWMGNVVSTMTAEGNELMLIPVGIMVAGGAIGLASRLIGR